jgi:hypothetical protein
MTAKPGKTEFVRNGGDIRITLATLGETLVDQERSSIKLHVSFADDEEEETLTFVLANFVPGKVRLQNASVHPLAS